MNIKGLRHGRSITPAGFTIVELLVVITIISTLITLLLPSLSRSRNLARLVACSGNQRQIGVSLGLYINDYGTRLPFFNNVGNVSSNIILNAKPLGPPDGFGRLFGGGYLGGLTTLPTTTPREWPPKVAQCPGRDQHGRWNSTTDAYGDYAIGWASSSDDFVGGGANGGFPGQQLRANGAGNSYWPDGTGWTGSPAPSFCPKLNQYAVEWYRTGTLFTTNVAGKSVLITDALSMGYNTPRDIPHLNVAGAGATTALMTDFRVVTVTNAFDLTNTTIFPNGYNNIRPWQWGSREWWNWMESKVPDGNRRNAF